MAHKKPDTLTGQHMTEGRAHDALSRLSGDSDAAEYLSRYLTYLHSENARLTLDNARLRGEAYETDGTEELTVRAGSGTYTRNQPKILMRWSCDICGKAHERYQLPGNTPRYCPATEGAKQSDCQREAAHRRVTQHRAAKRNMHNSLQPASDVPPPATAEPPAGVSPDLPFLPDYKPAPTRKQPPQFFAMTDVRRDVLAVYATGSNYQADYTEGIQKRKIARELAEAGLLSEVTGYTNHRKHNWRLTEAGLELIRRDADLQRRINERLPDDKKQDMHKTLQAQGDAFTWQSLTDDQRRGLIEVTTSAKLQKRAHRNHRRFKILAEFGLLVIVSQGKEMTTYTLSEAGKQAVLSAPDDYANKAGFYPLPHDVKAAKQAINGTLLAVPATIAPEMPPARESPAKTVPAWDALNERQQHYLKAIYEVDQEQEAVRQEAAARGDWDDTPASVWRWIPYYSEYGETDLQEELGADHIDPGTGSTFAALETRGLIETTGSVHQYNLKIKITKQGRAAVRAALGLKVTRKPAGLLSEWTWKALKLACEAGAEGIAGERWSPNYGGIMWDTWVRLRNHPNGEMVEEFPGGGGIRITAVGRAVYLQRLELHRQHYPHLYKEDDPG